MILLFRDFSFSALWLEVISLRDPFCLLQYIVCLLMHMHTYFSKIEGCVYLHNTVLFPITL